MNQQPAVKVRIAGASEADATELAALRTRVADDLTRRHGRGHWSAPITEATVLRAVAGGHVLAARTGDGIVATLWLSARKPWAIDLQYFTSVDRAVYLHGMAVAPNHQRRGIGRPSHRACGRRRRRLAGRCHPPRRL